MLEFLYKLDVSVLYFINHTLANPFFDKFFPFITEVKNWYIAYILLFIIIILKGGRIGRIAAAVFILLIISTDQFSSFFLKNLVARIRPCNVFNDLNILVTCTGSYSFPSSHAVNNFGAAIFFTKFYPKYKWYFYTVAVLLSFSRPYVGVHYPSDALAGAVIGLVFGYVFALVAIKIDNLIETRKTKITNKYERIR